jgi:hypothetical protein
VSRVEYSLICDDPTCTRQLGAAAREDDVARMRVLEAARAAGWDVDSVGHRCPEHRRIDPA